MSVHVKGFGISGPMSFPPGSISLLPDPFQGVGIWGWVCPGGGYSPPGLGMSVGMGMPSGWVCPVDGWVLTPLGWVCPGVGTHPQDTWNTTDTVQKRVVRILLLNLYRHLIKYLERYYCYVYSIWAVNQIQVVVVVIVHLYLHWQCGSSLF